MNTLVRPGTSRQDEARGAADEQPRTADTAEARPDGARPAGARSARVRDADGMAVASFAMGLVGLLVFNLVLGPCALVLAGLALKRGTTRRARAVLGLTLGAADLLVLAAVSSADHSFSWSLTG